MYAQQLWLLQSQKLQHSRRIYSILDVFGDFGGLKEVIFLIVGFFLAPWSEFSYSLKAIQKLYNVKSKKPSEFRKTKSQKYLDKMKKLDVRITKREDRIKMKQVYLGKINTCDQLSLFVREIFNCFPDNILHARDQMSRWFMIGKARFEKEIEIIKMLKSLRRTKIF